MSDNDQKTFTAANVYKVDSIIQTGLRPGDAISIYNKDGKQKRQGTVASVGEDGKGVLALAGEVLMEAGDFLVLEPRVRTEGTVKIWDDEDGPDTKPTCDVCGEEMEPCTAVYCAQEGHVRCPDCLDHLAKNVQDKETVYAVALELGCCSDPDCSLREVRRLKKLAEVREWR